MFICFDLLVFLFEICQKMHSIYQIKIKILILKKVDEIIIQLFSIYNNITFSTLATEVLLEQHKHIAVNRSSSTQDIRAKQYNNYLYDISALKMYR